MYVCICVSYVMYAEAVVAKHEGCIRVLMEMNASANIRATKMVTLTRTSTLSQP